MGCTGSKVQITLYGLRLSPMVRGTLLVCDALGVQYDFKEINLMTGEHMTPEFLEMNPLHTIPTIKDGDFVLFESHAIAVYLAERTGSENWYPKDPKGRAIIHQRLHFNNGVLFNSLGRLTRSVLFEGRTAFADQDVVQLEAAVLALEKLLGDKVWMATDDHPTIADCCIAGVLSTVEVISPVPLPNRLVLWLQRCEQSLPNYVTNKKGAEALGVAVKSRLLVQSQ